MTDAPHDIEHPPPPAGRDGSNAWSNAVASSGASSPKRRGLWKLILGGGAGVVVLLVVGVVLAPSLLGGVAARRGEQLASDSIAGSVRITDVTLSWRGPLRAQGVSLLDPEGTLVADIDVDIQTGLLDLLLGPSAPITVAISGTADLVGDADGVLNVQRAIAPAPGASSGGPAPGATPAPPGAGGSPPTWPAGYDLDLVLDGFTVTARQQGAGAVLTQPVSVSVRSGRVAMGAGQPVTAGFELMFKNGGADAGELRIAAASQDLIGVDGVVNIAAPTFTSEWTLTGASADWLASMGGAINPAFALEPEQVRDSLGETLDATWSINADADSVVLAASAAGARVGLRDVEIRVPRSGLGSGPGTGALQASGSVNLRDLPVALIDTLARGDAWLTGVLGDRLTGSIDIATFDGSAGSGTIDLSASRAKITAALDISADAVSVRETASVVWADPSARAVERLGAMGVLLRSPAPGQGRAIALRARGLSVPLSGELGSRVRGSAGVLSIEPGGWAIGATQSPGVAAVPGVIRVHLTPDAPAHLEMESAVLAGAPFAPGPAGWTRDGGRVAADVRVDAGAYLDANGAGDPDAWRRAGARGSFQITRLDAAVLNTVFGLLKMAPPLPEDELAHVIGGGLSAELAFSDADGVLGASGFIATERVRVGELSARYNTAAGTLAASTVLEASAVRTAIIDRLGSTDGWGVDLMGDAVNAKVQLSVDGALDALAGAQATLNGRVWGRDVEGEFNASNNRGEIIVSGTNRVTWRVLSPAARDRIATMAGVRIAPRTDEARDWPELVVEAESVSLAAPLVLDQVAGVVRVRAPGSDLRMEPTSDATPVASVAGTSDAEGDSDAALGVWLRSLAVRDISADITLSPGQPARTTGGVSLVKFEDTPGVSGASRAEGAGRFSWTGSVTDWLGADGALAPSDANVSMRVESTNIAPWFIGSAAVALGVAKPEQVANIAKATGSAVEMAWDVRWDSAGLVVTGGASSRHVSVRAVEAVVGRAGLVAAGDEASEAATSPLDHARFSGTVAFEQVQAMWLDEAVQAGGWLADISGPTVSGTVNIRDLKPSSNPQATSGVVTIGVESQTARFDAELVASDGWLVAGPTPILEWHTLTEAGSARVRSTGEIFQVVSKRREQDQPARFSITNLRVPLDFDINRMTGTLNIAPGDVRFRFSDRLTPWIRDTRPALDVPVAGLDRSLTTSTVSVRPERFQAFDVVMINGVIRFENAAFPVGENQVTANGTFNLVNNTERISLRVPARIVNLPQFDQSVWAQAASQGALVRFVREGSIGAAQWGLPEPMFDIEKAIGGTVRDQLDGLLRRGLEDIFNRNRGNDGESGSSGNGGG